MFKHHHHTLPSGLQVISVPMPSVKSVTVMAMANTGSRYEKPKEQGIAHFLEHMVFKGTAQYPDALTLAGAIDAIGADFNAFTSKEYTGYYVKAASRHFATAVDVVSDMLLTPTLRQEDIDREKGVIVEEINMYEDTPMRSIGDVFEEMYYRGSGLAHKVTGYKQTVTELRSADFVRFLKSWYGLGNIVLVLAGDEKIVNSKKTLELITESFQKKSDIIGARAEGRVQVKDFFSKKSPVSSRRLQVQYKKTEQAHFVLGWPGLERDHEEKYALSLLGTALGGTMSSRLFSEVREKRGLCYYVRSDVDFYHNAGMFGASAGVDPKRIEEALKVTIAEFQKVASGESLISEEELRKAKDYTAGTMALNLEDSKSVAQYYGMKQILSDVIESPEEVLKRIEAVTLDAVNAIAAQLIKQGELRLAVIGPYKSETRFKGLG